MLRRCLLFTCFALTIAAAADDPSVIVTFPDIRYPIVATSVQEVDFNNLRYKMGNHWFQLHNGIGSKEYGDGVREPRSREDLSLDQSFYFDRDSKGIPQHALIVLTYTSIAGSSSEEGVIQVFGIRAGHPRATQQLDYDRQAPGTGSTFDPSTGLLTVTARTADDSAHCCPKHVDIACYRWNGNEFKLEQSRTVALPDQPPQH